ncbi:MAG: hypothetical protein RID93_34140, partial [Sandaracinaceae bacterium]
PGLRHERHPSGAQRGRPPWERLMMFKNASDARSVCRTLEHHLPEIAADARREVERQRQPKLSPRAALRVLLALPLALGFLGGDE